MSGQNPSVIISRHLVYFTVLGIPAVRVLVEKRGTGETICTIESGISLMLYFLAWENEIRHIRSRTNQGQPMSP